MAYNGERDTATARRSGIAVDSIPQVTIDIEVAQAMVGSGPQQDNHLCAGERHPQCRAGIDGDHHAVGDIRRPMTFVVGNRRVVVRQRRTLEQPFIGLGAVAARVYGVCEGAQSLSSLAVLQRLQTAGRVVLVLADESGAAGKAAHPTCNVIAEGGLLTRPVTQITQVPTRVIVVSDWQG